jgi:hypothetical protein
LSMVIGVGQTGNNFFEWNPDRSECSSHTILYSLRWPTKDQQQCQYPIPA